MVQIHIDKLAFGGSGFGRLDGKACFVPYTAPGDTVGITVTRSKSSYLEGAIQQIESPAECRVTPVCTVFGTCGGCNWQHVSYEMQCRQKEMIFAETMWRMARIEKEKILPLRVASDSLAYRQRIQLKVYCDNDRVSIGFFKPGSHHVVDLPQGCAIARPELNLALCELRAVLSSSPEPDRIPQVDLSAGEDGKVTALFHYTGHDPEGVNDYLAGLRGELNHIAAIAIKSGRKAAIKSVFGPELMEYTLASANARELSMAYSAESFSQINFRQNRCMIDTVLAWSAGRSLNTVLDLFCGNGNFSLPLSTVSGTVLGLESDGKSIELARHNARQNGIHNVCFTCEDSAVGVTKLAMDRKTFELILLDPPRSGADAVVRNLHKLRPEYLIYVSCDPPTLGRDLALLQKSGFRVESMQPVDMFPQTYHLESVTFLQAV